MAWQYKGVCNVAKDMMICWVAAEKHAGRFYGSMAQALPAFRLYLIEQHWTQKQADRIAAKAAE